MNQKQKAEQLVQKFAGLTYGLGSAKQCAIIAVNEIINTVDGLDDSIDHGAIAGYWREVETEIEKL